MWFAAIEANGILLAVSANVGAKKLTFPADLSCAALGSPRL
jgi:hypothetical protein